MRRDKTNMKYFFKKDLIQLLRAKDPRPKIEEKSDCRFLLEIINDAFNDDTKKPEDIRLYLERGIELTGMSAANLSERALELGYSELAEAYRSYSHRER